jgi:hypothetical protein
MGGEEIEMRPASRGGGCNVRGRSNRRRLLKSSQVKSRQVTGAVQSAPASQVKSSQVTSSYGGGPIGAGGIDEPLDHFVGAVPVRWDGMR